MEAARDPIDRARLLAVAAPHASDWLNALPIASCGLRLDNESIRVVIGLRLGLKICKPHECSCGAIVDKYGIHCLSCKYGPGRITRHSTLNDLLCTALCSSGIPAIKEPTGLVREDGKRPDSLSLVPWSAGKSLIWDETVADTLVLSSMIDLIFLTQSIDPEQLQLRLQPRGKIESMRQSP